MQVYTGYFTLVETDKDGKMFDNVSRSLLKSDAGTILMDYHSTYLECNETEQLEVTLFLQSDTFTDRDIPDKYTYLMGNGLVFDVNDLENEDQFDIYFSGMFVRLTIPKNAAKGLRKHKRVYLGVAPGGIRSEN